MNKKAVLNSLISIGTYQEFIQEVFALVKRKIPSYVCFANVHMVMEGYNDRGFQKVINNANITTPDGKPISIFLNHFNKLKQERVCGMDLLPDLLKQAEMSGKSVFFYGSTDDLLSTIVQKVTVEFPSLKISGCYAPPFRKLTDEENVSMLERIKMNSPDLVFVSLGCPKQEKWMAENRDKIGACLLGVGQAFKVYAGLEKRLPKWMRNFSLEWIFRLCLEPQRLWKRYLYTNTLFLLLTLGYWAKLFASEFLHPFENIKSARTVQRKV